MRGHALRGTAASIILAIALAVLTSAPAVAAPAKDGTVASSWAASPPKIDGKRDDWEEAAFSRWDKGDVAYAFRNDGDRLYVLLVFHDPKFLSTATQTGIRLYFSAAGKKDKGRAVQCARRQVPAEEAIAFIGREREMSEEEKAQLRAKPAYNIYDCQVLDKKGKPLADQPEPGPGFGPAHFRFAPDQKTVVFEFDFPLVRGQEPAVGVGAEPGREITVGFEWGWPTDEQRKKAALAAGQAGIANEEGSRGSVDRMDGVRRGGLPPKYAFWTGVRLAASAGS